MVAVSRFVLPVLFMMEGVSHHSFLLDLNGGELLLLAFTLTALKAGNCLNNPIFLLSFPFQVFLAMGLGDRWYVLVSHCCV